MFNLSVYKLLNLRAAAIAFFMLCTGCASDLNNGNVAIKPNIIVFVVDDMGLMDTSVPFVVGDDGKEKTHKLNQLYKTPNMARLASKGVRFSEFYAHSVCSPTRASLLTGQNSARHKTTTWIKPDENNHGKFGPQEWNWSGLDSTSVTFPALLKQQGYRTIHIGKGHFAPLDTEGADPLNIGFDVNIAGGPWGRPKSYYGSDQYGNHPKFIRAGKPLTHNIPHLEAYYGDDVFLTEALTQEANKQIQQAAEDAQPFMLYLSHYAVHAPFNPDPRFIDNYADLAISDKAKAYASLVEGMDKSLGDLVSQLEQLGIAENTLILFVGDNGSDAPLGHHDAIASSAPFKGKKGTSWEGGMRAPLITAWAKVDDKNYWQQRHPIKHGAINSQLATVMDIFPTILTVADIDMPPKHITDGFNLAEQMENQWNDARENSFLMHFPHQHRHSYFTVYRQGDWKLIYHYQPDGKNKTKRYQLFNLAQDRVEQNDLASSNKRKLYQMVSDMKAELTKQGAQYPTNKFGQTLAPKLPPFPRVDRK